MKQLVTKYKCVACLKNEIVLDEKHAENYKPTYMHNEWDGGWVFKLVTGFGSKHDGDMFIGAICDDCIQKFQDDGTLNYLGSYILESNLLQHVAKLINYKENMPDVDQIVNHPEFKNLVNGGRLIVPTLIHHMDEEPWLCCLLLEALLKINPVPSEHSGNIAEMKEDWREWLKLNGWEDYFTIP